MVSVNMKIKEVIFVWSAFLSCFLLSQPIQLFTHSLTIHPVSIGWIGFFSDYSQLNQVSGYIIPTRNIIVATLVAVFSFAMFFIANFIFVYKHVILRAVGGIFFGGICNLLIIYVLYGKIVNNMSFSISNRYLPFNIPILFTFLGAGLFCYLLITDKKWIFQSTSLRKSLWVQDKNQHSLIAFILVGFSIIYIVTTSSLGVYFYTALSQFDSSHQIMKNYYVLTFLLYILSVSVVALVMLIFSHRIYGPVYGFQQYMQKLFTHQSDQSEIFQVRKKDHFKTLETTAEHIRTRIFKKI